jgi:hypothetical protein
MRMHRRYTSFHHTIHNFCTCICINTRAFDNHNAKTRHEEKFKENMQQSQLAHRSITMIIALVVITVDTIMYNQVSIVINVIIIIITIISSSKNMLANQSSSSSPSPQTASKPSFFHHRNHNRHHHNAQETLVTSRQRKHQRGKKNTAYQCQTKPITTQIRFHKIKHAPHQNFTHHTSQSRFNAIAIAIAAKSNSGIRLQFVNNMHNSNKKTNFKAMQNQHQINNSNRTKHKQSQHETHDDHHEQQQRRHHRLHRTRNNHTLDEQQHAQESKNNNIISME